MQQVDRNLYHGRRSGAMRKRFGFLPRIQWLVSSCSIIVILLYICVYRMAFDPAGKLRPPTASVSDVHSLSAIANNAKDNLFRSGGLQGTKSLLLENVPGDDARALTKTNHQPAKKTPKNFDHQDIPGLDGNDNHQIQLQDQNRKQEQRTTDDEDQQGKSSSVLLSFDFWREFAVSLAAQTPDKVLEILENNDPFGVRTFERKLLDAESARGAFLDLAELPNLFPCPPKEKRITVPDQRDQAKAQSFRDESEAIRTGMLAETNPTETFLFFQHLRKAGGTNFCSLAEHNLPRQNLPSYYCMPDYQWKHDVGKTTACAGCAMQWTNDEVITRMRDGRHRIFGNEWDPFDADRFFDLPALFATSFRRPLDRALSQFRFECIEERGCKIKVVEEWWAKRTDLTNVYTWTFAKRPVYKISVGTTELDAAARQHAIGVALDTLAKFHIVMAMEWLAYAPQHVTEVLGFADTAAMTTRVRPHIRDHARDDGQEKNSLGAAGIAKASWTPKKYLSPEQYKIMSENLALDEILTDAARRMFLERLVCAA